MRVDLVFARARVCVCWEGGWDGGCWGIDEKI